MKLVKEVNQWNKFIQPVLFVYKTKELRISKQSSYMLVYGRKLILVINYRKYYQSYKLMSLALVDLRHKGFFS